MADLPSKEEMAKMSHSDLITLRDKNPSKEAQDAIAPYEHRAFTREYVAENPVTGTLGMVGAIPAYQAAKAAGLTKSRSGASVDQAVEATKGVGEGIAKATENINPWEIDWNPVGQKALEAVKTAVEPIKKAVAAVLPWDIDWGSKRPIEAPSPIPEQKPSPPRSKVFQKVVQAESGGIHETEPGKLISSNLPNDPAEGITQLRRSTANNPGYGITPVQDRSKSEYLRVGEQYLNAITNDLGGDVRKGVAAYNAGIGKVKKIIDKHGDNWEQFLPAETKKYLNNVLGGLTGSSNANAQGYGKRQDGTEKGRGYYGEIKAPGGKVSTEISIGIDFGQGEMQIPTMVPGLTRAELDDLVKNGKPSKAVVDKAVAHARQRIKEGKSPFAGKGEDTTPVPIK